MTGVEEAVPCQQSEIVCILPSQYPMTTTPDGFALEIIDFLGPGDPDRRGNPTVWVRGPTVGANLSRGRMVSVAIPHDQPRACRTGGAVLRPPIPDAYERHVTMGR